MSAALHPVGDPQSVVSRIGAAIVAEFNAPKLGGADGLTAEGMAKAALLAIAGLDHDDYDACEWYREGDPVAEKVRAQVALWLRQA